MNPAKAAEQIEVPFGMCTRVAQGLGGAQVPQGKAYFWGSYYGMLPAVDILNRVH